MNDELANLGWMGPVAFVFLVAILVAVGVPRLLLCPAAGMAFGFWAGLLLSQAGTVLGYYVVFLFVRWGGRAFVLRHRPQLLRFTERIRHQGIPAVILARQLPVHGLLVNLVLSLSPIRHRDFLIGSAIGLIPEAVPCTLIGTGAAQASLARSAGLMVLAVVGLALAWAGFAAYTARQERRSRNDPTACVGTESPGSGV